MQLAFPTTPAVSVKRRVVIQAPIERVFAYVADLRNDAQWRQEINKTTLDAAAPALGVVATEDAYLSGKQPHALSRLAYMAFEPNRYVRCTAPADNPTWTDVVRRFRETELGATEFVYELSFEQKVVQQALGFAPPLWFLRWYTGWMMSRYLRRLKQQLETMPASGPQPVQAA